MTQQATQVRQRTIDVPGASLYVEIRGSHGGWGSDPQEFAERLHELLQEAR